MASAYPPPTTVGEAPFSAPGLDQPCKTAYSIWGNLADGIPLICLHGGPGHPSQYMRPHSLLHTNHGVPVVLYDQLGCGKSTRLPSKRGDTAFWTIDLFIAELRNLLSVLGIQRFDLLGHSWGGILATSFALTQPPGLRKLMLMSAPPNIARRVASTRRLRKRMPEIDEVMTRCEAAGTTDSDEYRAARKVFSSRHICTLDPLPFDWVDGMGEDNTVPATMLGGLMAPGPLGSYNVDARLHEITAKTAPGGVLVTNGENDTSQDEVVRPYFTNIAARVMWIKYTKSSHTPLFEETEKYIADVAAFLSSA